MLGVFAPQGGPQSGNPKGGRETPISSQVLPRDDDMALASLEE